MKARPQDRTTNRPAKRTRNGAGDSDPDWSPDGTTVAFASDRTGDEEIWLMLTAGTSATNLTRSAKPEDFRPDWQPFP